MHALFSEDPEFRRVQYQKLSDNPKEWPEQITSLVQKRLPPDLNLGVQVVFQKVNDEKGYAIGSAVISEPSTGNAMGIPLVVKAWHLAPLDLLYKDNVLYPLTQEHIAQAFFHGSVGIGVASRDKVPNMADDSLAEFRHPPYGGKYSYSSAEPLDLRGTLLGDDIHAFCQAIQSQPEVMAKMANLNTVPVFLKWAQAKPAVTQQDETDKQRSMAYLTVVRDAPNAYRMYSSPEEVFQPDLINTDREGLKHYLEMRKSQFWDYDMDPVLNLDRYGCFTITPPPSPYGKEVDGPAGPGVDGSGGYGASLGVHKNPWVFDPHQHDRLVSTIDRLGRYGVRDEDGVLSKGWVLPNVVNFDGSQATVKLFIGSTMSAAQGRISGIPMNDDANITLKASQPEVGKEGTLIHQDGKSLIATTPFKVSGVTVFKNFKSLSVNDRMGHRFNLVLTPSVQGIIKLKDTQRSEMAPLLGPGENYLVPAQMLFVAMPKLTTVSEEPGDFRKIATAKMDPAPLKVSCHRGLYCLRSPHLAKYASQAAHANIDFNRLPAHEAAFCLRRFGLDGEKTAEVLREAPRHVHLEVHDLPWPEHQQAKVAHEPNQWINSLRPPMTELVKVAVNLKDAESIDSVLATGFVNEQNIQQFMASKEVLLDAQKTVAKLLLASRMGMEDIPEQAAQMAISYLQKLIAGLGKMEMQAKKMTLEAA